MYGVTLRCSEVKCSEGLSNTVSNIVRRHIDHMKFAAYVAFPSVTFLFVTILALYISFVYFRFMCMFCIVLFSCANYVFYCYVYILLLLCM
jgi:hypothetical protein